MGNKIIQNLKKKERRKGNTVALEILLLHFCIWKFQEQ